MTHPTESDVARRLDDLNDDAARDGPDRVTLTLSLWQGEHEPAEPFERLTVERDESGEWGSETEHLNGYDP